MTAVQKAHLKDRLQRAFAIRRNQLPDNAWNDRALPKELKAVKRTIVRLEARIERWKKIQRQKNEESFNQLRKEREDVEAMLLFGTADQALSSLIQFERRVKK